MQEGSRICKKVIVTPSQREQYIKREIHYIPGTPKLQLGKFIPAHHSQEIWITALQTSPIWKLRQSFSAAISYPMARSIIAACQHLKGVYGNFMLNENMVFFEGKEVYVWINPDIMENKVKIYLEKDEKGERAMVRSVVSYLKLWIKIDYT